VLKVKILVIIANVICSVLSFFSHDFALDPNFVSSFAFRDKVYFFFREMAVENINCGKVSNVSKVQMLYRKIRHCIFHFALVVVIVVMIEFS